MPATMNTQDTDDIVGAWLSATAAPSGAAVVDLISDSLFLGLQIDPHLDWERFVNDVCSSICDAGLQRLVRERAAAIYDFCTAANLDDSNPRQPVLTD